MILITITKKPMNAFSVPRARGRIHHPSAHGRSPGRNLSVRQMRAFVAIGRLKSFTQAARLLHSTQPALSARIRELEVALDLRLFDRNTRSVRLTQAGEDLLPVVAQVLADLGSLLERAKDVATRNTGRVTVAALPSISSECFPRPSRGSRGAIPAFRSECEMRLPTACSS